MTGRGRSAPGNPPATRYNSFRLSRCGGLSVLFVCQKFRNPALLAGGTRRTCTSIRTRRQCSLPYGCAKAVHALMSNPRTYAPITSDVNGASSRSAAACATGTAPATETEGEIIPLPAGAERRAASCVPHPAGDNNGLRRRLNTAGRRR